MDISQRNLLELAMSSLPTGLFICDRDGIIRFINDAYANYLRVRPEDAMGRHITDFIPDSGIPAVIASGEPELGAWRSIQGSERKILVNRIPLRDQDGHVIGAFSLTLFDTPEQMQALLQRVDFLDKKVNSYARRIPSPLRRLACFFRNLYFSVFLCAANMPPLRRAVHMGAASAFGVIFCPLWRATDSFFWGSLWI